MIKLVPFITSTINVSLKEGCIAGSMKKAYVHPLLKKLGLDQEVFKNYHLISSFILKILEKAANTRSDDHLMANNLMNEMQFAHTSYYSTEIAR